MVVVPVGKVYVPTWPVPEEVSAPVIAHAKLLPAQLSPKVASVIATSTVQSPDASSLVFAATLAAAVTVGSSSSVTVTVIDDVAVLLDPSVTV